MATPVAVTSASNVRASNNFPQPLYYTAPQQLIATNLALDAAAILVVETDIKTGVRNRIMSGGQAGTYAAICLQSALADANGSAVVVVGFGRYSSTDPWEPLWLADNSGKSLTLTTATATDVTDATWRYTYAAPTKWFNRAGYRETVYGVTSAYTGASVATSSLFMREV